MNFFKGFILLPLFILLCNASFAQKKFSDNLNGMINFHNGYNLPEYPFLSALTQDYIRSFEIALYKETIGNNVWEQIYNYPTYGISLFYSNLGNDEVFGKELALTYFLKFYFYSKNRFRLYNRLGIGFGYVTKTFDLKDNYLNVAVGSHYNIHFNFRVGGSYELSDKFSLNTGVSFDHFSNGNTSEPNLGINYLTGYAGLGYSLGKKTERKEHTLPDVSKENSYTFFASIGGKHSRALTSNFFLTSSLSFEFDRAVSRKIHLGFGSDFFYDSSVESSLQKKSQDYQKSNSMQTGIHLSQSIVYDKFMVSIQEGIYLILKEKVDNYTIYNRLVVQYQISKHLAARIAMKSHLHILDYPEIGIGYKL